jgi:hypothetical protein
MIVKEVNRFSFIHHDRVVRNIVFKDDEGNYHINEQTIVDVGKVSIISGKQSYTERKDIHGPMTIETYNSWLTNALFNMSCKTSSLLERNEFLFGD